MKYLMEVNIPSFILFHAKIHPPSTKYCSCRCYDTQWKKGSGAMESYTKLQLHKFIKIVKSKWKLCLAMVLSATLLAYLYSQFAVKPTYKSNAQLIVTEKADRPNGQFTYGDLQLNQKLVATLVEIIKSERISDRVLQRLNGKITARQYYSQVSVHVVAGTELIQITVESHIPSHASTLANEIAYVCLLEVPSIIPVKNIALLSAAKASTIPVSPHIALNTWIGFFLGVGGAGACCYILFLFQSTITQIDELTSLLPYPLIAQLPNVEEENQNLIAQTMQLEAYRSLRTNFLFRCNLDQSKVVSITSYQAKEGKSTLIANLAQMLASAEKKVLVIDLDLRAPTMHRQFSLQNKAGITDLINQHITVEDATISITSFIDLIPAGTKIPYASEFLQSKRLAEFIHSMKDYYHYVLLDSPPGGVISDGSLIAHIADETILVVSSGKNQKKQLLELHETFQLQQIQILGMVLTMADINTASYARYTAYLMSDTTEKKRSSTVKQIFQKIVHTDQ